MTPIPARPPQPEQPARRAAVREIGRGGSAVPIIWDVRTGYDFVFSLSDDAGSTGDLIPSDRRWLEESKLRLRERVGAAALDLYGSEFCVALAELAVDRPEIDAARSFVAFMDAADGGLILRTLLGEYMREPAAAAEADRALEGDPEAIRALAARFAADHHGDEEAERLTTVLRQPDAVLAQARSVLRAWLPAFETVEPRVRAMLERDVALRAADRQSLAPADLIERTTGGIRWLSEPRVRRVILAPSYFSRPYNMVLGGTDWRLFGYPISDAALDAADPLAPPQSVLRLHRALGDETRLRILRLLRDGDLYLTQIAEQLSLSKPTIKHHLALLRAAGLVTLTEEGGLSYYALRRERLDDASRELVAFLGH